MAESDIGRGPKPTKKAGKTATQAARAALRGVSQDTIRSPPTQPLAQCGFEETMSYSARL